MSLRAQLEACRRTIEVTTDPAAIADMRSWIRKLDETGITAAAVKAGERAPPFRARSERGGVVALSRLLDRGPVVISFFWGAWCPFFAVELRAFADARHDLERLGATLVAVSPAAPGTALTSGEDLGPSFLVVRDCGGKIATRYRIGFTVPQPFRSAYLAAGYPEPAKPGSQGWRLPVPATYLVDSRGFVVLSYLDPDYTTRLDPADILIALDRLRAQAPGWRRGHSRRE